jgi:hypothetical protein
MVNSHYVPRFIIKEFKDEKNPLCLFDLKTKTLNLRAGPVHSFSEMGFYSEILESELNAKCEQKFFGVVIRKLTKKAPSNSLVRNY